MAILTVGTGAGLVSALMMAVLSRETALAMVLWFLAPIPILVAALGWNHRSGLVAAAVGGLATAAAASPILGLNFALCTGLPAWWLAYLALLGRPAPDGTLEWYPTGRLLAWLGATPVVWLAGGLITVGGYERFAGLARQMAEATLRQIDAIPATVPLSPERLEIAERFAQAVPAMGGLALTLVLVANLWLAARVVALSGRLPRPWPYLPATLMPRGALLALAGAMVAASLEGAAGAFGQVVTAGLVMAFALQGLAGLHELTLGRRGRPFILTGTYLLLLMSQVTLMVPLLLFGLADTAFGLRARSRLRRALPPHPPTP